MLSALILVAVAVFDLISKQRPTQALNCKRAIVILYIMLAAASGPDVSSPKPTGRPQMTEELMWQAEIRNASPGKVGPGFRGAALC